MTVLAGILCGSVLLLSGFFAFKDWERQRGQETVITLFLKKHSPGAQQRYRSAVIRVSMGVAVFVGTIRFLFRFGLQRIITFARTGIVVLGAHMIHAARGEHLMAEGRIPSTYFKLLHRHKEKMNGTDIPKGIAQPDIPRRVKIRMAEEDSGAAPVGQVE